MPLEQHFLCGFQMCLNELEFPRLFLLKERVRGIKKKIERKKEGSSSLLSVIHIFLLGLESRLRGYFLNSKSKFTSIYFYIIYSGNKNKLQ